MKKNNTIFLSHPFSTKTPSYGNRDMVKLAVNSSIKSGETANSSCWVFTSNHIGTHIDVPHHFDESGKKTGDYKPEEWIFSSVGFIEIPCNNATLIDETNISGFDIDPDIEILLIRTNFEYYRGEDRYWNDNPGLSPKLASYLRNNFNKLRCVGFDFISITSWKYRMEGREAHKNFLKPQRVNEKPILAIEDMSLINITNKINWMVVAPVIAEDGNGAPVTVIANQE